LPDGTFSRLSSLQELYLQAHKLDLSQFQ
jgi:hypothetical protein